MTAMQHRNQANVFAALEAERVQAELAVRPVLTLREQAQSLAQAMIAAKDAGNLDRARELATELKPLLSYLD